MVGLEGGRRRGKLLPYFFLSFFARLTHFTSGQQRGWCLRWRVGGWVEGGCFIEVLLKADGRRFGWKKKKRGRRWCALSLERTG
jgi:hypothetical protein